MQLRGHRSFQVQEGKIEDFGFVANYGETMDIENEETVENVKLEGPAVGEKPSHLLTRFANGERLEQTC